MTKYYISCTKCQINLAPSAVKFVGASAYCTKCDNDQAVEDLIAKLFMS
jgi:hypothetical protein